MKKAKVAVIIPSLNSIKYIKECLESVLNQSLKDLQIICVDAKSKDGTLEFLQSYAKKDERIQVIISDKKSYGYQMNLGIKAANAEYLGIVESDDYIKPKMYEKLYNLAQSKDCEVVKGDIVSFKDEQEQREFELNSNAYDKSFYKKIISYQKDGAKLLTQTWCMNQSGIYKLDFLKKFEIFFNETPGASYQDTGFHFQSFSLAKSIYFTKEAFYYYRRDNENSSSASKEKVYCICDEFSFIEKFMLKNNLKDLKQAFLYLKFKAYKWNLYRIDTKYRLEFLQQFALEFQKAQNELDCDLFHNYELLELENIMKNPNEFYQNTASKEKGAVLEVKNTLAYKIGNSFLKNPLKILISILKTQNTQNKHSKDEVENLALKLENFSDYYEGLKAMNHLSFKFGFALLKALEQKRIFIILPFELLMLYLKHKGFIKNFKLKKQKSSFQKYKLKNQNLVELSNAK